MLLFPPLPASSRVRRSRARSPARPPKTKGSPTAKPEGRVTGNVTDYEVLIMLDPELPDERRRAIHEQAQQALGEMQRLDGE